MLSASASGIWIPNSSSNCKQISTASNESKSRSSLNLDVAETMVGFTFTKKLVQNRNVYLKQTTFSKDLTTSITRSVTTFTSKKGCYLIELYKHIFIHYLEMSTSSSLLVPIALEVTLMTGRGKRATETMRGEKTTPENDLVLSATAAILVSLLIFASTQTKPLKLQP